MSEAKRMTEVGLTTFRLLRDGNTDRKPGRVRSIPYINPGDAYGSEGTLPSGGVAEVNAQKTWRIPVSRSSEVEAGHCSDNLLRPVSHGPSVGDQFELQVTSSVLELSCLNLSSLFIRVQDKISVARLPHAHCYLELRKRRS